MLQLVEENKTYVSPSGLLFKVLYLGKHGQDCTVPMVIYTNLVPTSDAPIGQTWVMEESLFLKLFTEKPDDVPSEDFNREDWALIRAVLLAHIDKPSKYLTGTVNWAAHMAAKIKQRLKKDAPHVE